MNIVLTPEQAEEVLIALTMRAQQRGLSRYQRDTTDQIGDYLATEFGAHFGWDSSPAPNVYRAHLRQSRTVIIRP